MLEIYEQRNDPNAVASYLAKLDEEVQVRKSQPHLYKRGHAKKNNVPATPVKKVEEKTKPGKGLDWPTYLQRAEQRAAKKGKQVKEADLRKRFNQRDQNKDGVLNGTE